MLFNSFQYLLFFPIVTVIYFALSSVKHRKTLLLIASWFFYTAWKPEYIFLLLLSTVVDYWAARQINKNDDLLRRRLYLLFSITVNLGILFGFKYLNFFDKNIHRFLAHYHIYSGSSFHSFLLPVGISFYTFQTMSYTIDVYRKKIKPERQFKKFALFVSFFPQLVAGPIERASHLLPQFDIKHSFDYKRVTDGLELIFWGFFQKIVIADSMARFVNIVYSNPSNYHSLDIILVTFFFGVQIYGDFSGYTDIARGSAKILGYDIRINFNLPYFAMTFADFWRRWHISLSSWFRDYIYIPLGGSRTEKTSRIYFNVMFTFVLSGFWHGASWNFIIWGGLHGTYYIIENFINNKFPKIKSIDNKIYNVFRIIFVFTLVNFAWIFFRSPSVKIAITLIQNLFDFTVLKISFDRPSILINFLLAFFLFVVHYFERKKDIVAYISEKPALLRWSIYYFSALLILAFGNFGLKEFIYFQF